MSTKNIKAGLSKANVNTIAGAIGTATLNRLVPQFSTSVSYTKGQYTNYNNQLYRFTDDKSAGAWDSTKVESATLNDLIDDVNDAVDSVDDKANVDGNYPTMTVGVADQLSPYDEKSGDDQDEPFSFQATGTGNGTQPDFATGSIALMKEKQGNTVVVNQLVQNGNFDGFTNWTNVSVNSSVSDNICSFTATVQYGRITQDTYLNANHYYLAIASIKSTTATTDVSLQLSLSGVNKYISIQSNTNWQTLYLLTTTPFTQSGNGTIMIIDARSSDWDAIKVKEIRLIDLTQMFNGDIPPDLLDNPENFFRYYQGDLSYNTGALVNANGRYIKCIGMNQWDEEWELGKYSASGEKESANNQIRSKNFINVIPNVAYRLYTGTASPTWICYYDNNKNFISGETINNTTFTTPSNCCYITFTMWSNYGATYNNDISINLYYEDEARCLTYEPYQVLTNNDTGTEVLRSAGSVKDCKTPDGTIKRNVGYVDLGTLSWNYDSDAKAWATPTIGLNIKPPINLASKINAVSANYIVTSVASAYGQETPNVIYANRSGTLYVNNGSTTTEPSGSFQFELETPTTEQGTPYSENLVIDDFGSMSFEGTNGVPQGALIFYPVDYKAFIDTLYNYTKGTPSNLALNSELNAKFETYLKSLSGYDASATQVLKNVEGTLTWVTEGE